MAGEASTTPSDLAKSGSEIALKTFRIYDVNERLTEFYEAKIIQQEGDPCLKTTYTYTTPTGGLIEKTKEEVVGWPVGADI